MVIVLSCSEAALMWHLCMKDGGSRHSEVALYGRVAAFARVLRGVQLLMKFRSFRQLFASLATVISVFNTLFGLLIVLFYFYATIGVQIFGGVERGRVDDQKAQPLHFNDFYSSLVTLFVLMVNGWDESLMVIIKKTSVVSALYCGSFFVFADTILLNLFVTLVLETYDQFKNGRKRSDADEVEHSSEEILKQMFEDELKEGLCTVSNGVL